MKLIESSELQILLCANARLTNIIRVFVFVIIMSCGVFAQEWKWQNFSPENGAWSVLAPGALKPDAEATEPNSKKGSYAYNDPYGFFAVVYRDSRKRVVPWKANYKAFYRKVSKGFVRAGRGELIKDVEVTNSNGAGREVYIKIPAGTIMGSEGQVIQKYRVERLRMFFHKKRFYMLIAVLPEKEIDAPAINKYFDSFVVN